jgi:hypothetical protein
MLQSPTGNEGSDSTDYTHHGKQGIPVDHQTMNDYPIFVRKCQANASENEYTSE